MLDIVFNFYTLLKKKIKTMQLSYTHFDNYDVNKKSL